MNEEIELGINRDKLVCWFIQKYPQFYLDMVNSNHCVDLLQPNIFHTEGTVWTHTMMVMTWIEAMSISNVDDYYILITSGLLHDLGKPSCEELSEATEVKPIRNSFSGHEGMSVYLGIEVLKSLKEDFPDVYTDEVIEFIIKIVGTHGVALDGEPGRFLDLREKFRIADKRGAVRQVDEGLFSQYGKRNFSTNKNLHDDKEVVVVTGLPCVGKSTLISQEYNEHKKISRDDQLMVFFREKEPQAPKMSYSEVYKYIHSDEKLQKEFNDYFEKYIGQVSKNDKKVVVDMTMMPLSSRRKMMNKFPNHRRKSVVMMTDRNTLSERNVFRKETEGKYIPLHVFENMAKSFTYPVEAEGFDDIRLIIN